MRFVVSAVVAALLCAPAAAQQPAKKSPALSTATLGGLKLRSIGPATHSGRIAAFAVHPKNRDHYYVAVASGGVWKTTNAGTTWTPVFDNEGSYSIGAIALDPKNPNVVWVGTGENNSQRSVGYGDGLYRSDDGGKTWRKMGLEKSEHIGKIVIDPRNSDVVYLAAQGPLWSDGGDRGLFKTADGGKTWEQIIDTPNQPPLVGPNSGVTDVVLDLGNPNVILAATYQRRRHVWTLIAGGPKSAIVRSADGGKTWKKITAGLPKEDLGRIGLAVTTSKPDVVYATVEAAEKKGGLFRSLDGGLTWERRNDFDLLAMYFGIVVADPKNHDRVYLPNVRTQVSDDGGKTLRKLGGKHRHVDDHALWIDPNNPDFYRIGGDGGIYESHDRGATWKHVSNLPITQFYDVTVDETGPFYNVYGGTQDNHTLGGPARTRSASGIGNADWHVLLTGDGFQARVDPKDPNTVYCEMQYGVLGRHDRRTGQTTGIQPQPGKGEPGLRWNWDSPLILSPHKNTRVYFAANKLFRSDDRGDSWKAVSGDLTRQIDRNKLPVMGKVWGADAVNRHTSTSLYGNCIALSESPKKEGLIYVGTDDGLVQITEDGGKNWRKVEKFPGVPEMTYVTRLLASQHDERTVYLTFSNHKNGDFKPYALKSTDAGATWKSIAGDLPERGNVLAIAEDHLNPNLLFLGTEFALYFTLDGGKQWVRLKAGLPTIAVKDLAIQRQMNDLVVATFGRGFYVLDDYSALRDLSPELLKGEASLLGVRDAVQFVPSRQYGLTGKASLGDSFYIADNPPYGATLTYYLRDTLKTLKQQRQDAEKLAGDKVPQPTADQLRAEAEEEAPAILLTVSDEAGRPLRTLVGPVTAGSHRVAWDLREPAAALPKVAEKREADEDEFSPAPKGPEVPPGTYKVTMAKRVRGKVTPLGEPRTFKVYTDPADPVILADRKELYEFQRKLVKLQRAVNGTVETATELLTRLDRIKRTLDHTPAVEAKWKEVARGLEQKARDVVRALRGDAVLRKRNENTPASVTDRIAHIVFAQRYSFAPPTKTQRDAYATAEEEMTRELGRLRTLIDGDLRALERALDDSGAPWVPGRLPEWPGK